MKSLPLKKFIRLTGEKINLGAPFRDKIFGSISIDTRTLKAGAVYFALRGELFDGHTFIPQAMAKGALACVVRKDRQGEFLSGRQGSIIGVDDPLFSLQQLAGNYRAMFAVPVLAITGTNGKTTTKEMIASVLAQKYKIVKTPGNLNNHIGLPLSLLQIEDDTEIAVIEMGTNHFGEIERLCEIARPDHGLITNIGAGHLEFFGSVDDVAGAKAELFKSLPEDGLAFVNADDSRIMAAAKIVRQQIRYSLHHDAEVRGEFLSLNPEGCAGFRLQNQVEVQLQVPGEHQISNALAAAAVGIYWHIPLNDIATALENHRSFSKRMEKHEWHGAAILLDAYNSNPDSLRAALATLSHLIRTRQGRAVAVLGDMLELGEVSEAAHEKAGQEAAEAGVTLLLLYGDFAAAFERGFTRAGGKQVRVYSDKSTLAGDLQTLLQNGDVVLIKGSRGMAMETIWQELQTVTRQ